MKSRPDPSTLNLDDSADVRHTDVEVEGVRFHLAEAGPEDGQPIVLVHGWPQHWWCWRKVAPLLGEYRCVMPDLRGHGWSDAPADGYEKRRLAEDVLGIMDSLGLDRVTYAGHDWGAVIGFLLASKAPERISSFLALSVPHPWPSRHDRTDPRRLAAGLYQIPLSTPVLGEKLVRGGIVRKVFSGAAPAGTFSSEEEEIYLERISRREGARATVALYRSFLLRELPGNQIGRAMADPFSTTTRLLMGERDPIAMGADLEGYEPHAPHMTLEWVPGAGHFLPEEEPELVASHVRELAAFQGT